MENDSLILGIDGGATKTLAWLAQCDGLREPTILGRGSAGGANPHSVGFDQAITNLDRAIAGAFEDAGLAFATVSAAVLGLAGSDRDENRYVLHRWAENRHLARRFLPVHDALPVLAAESEHDWGIALIAGTGSFAFGQSSDRRTARAGGWGYLFGDEGSGYQIALAGLRAAAQSADGRASPTQLLEAIVAHFNVQSPLDIIPAIYPIAHDRAKIAALAGLVIETADAGDPTAQRILDDAAADLATMVAAVARSLCFSAGEFPLALAGGVLLSSERLQRGLQSELQRRNLPPASLALVDEPVRGAVRLAQRLVIATP